MKTAAGFLGLSGVSLGALGAHGLKSQLSASGTVSAWETAVLYHLIHAVALLALALAAMSGANSAASSRKFSVAAYAWTIGVCLFSGSLYTLAMGGPRWLGPVTPLGGVALLIGWACLLVPDRDNNRSR